MMNVTESTESAVSTATQSGVAVTFALFFHDAIIQMVPYLLASLVLIIVDLYFGVAAAKKRGEEVRLSRMVRRTVSKAVEYVCWVTLSASLSVAFDFPSLQYIILGIVAANELISILSNWSFCRGVEVKGADWLGFLGRTKGIDLSGIEIKNVKKKKNDEGHEEGE